MKNVGLQLSFYELIWFYWQENLFYNMLIIVRKAKLKLEKIDNFKFILRIK